VSSLPRRWSQRERDVELRGNPRVLAPVWDPSQSKVTACVMQLSMVALPGKNTWGVDRLRRADICGDDCDMIRWTLLAGQPASDRRR
jgi:hypothetical protein